MILLWFFYSFIESHNFNIQAKMLSFDIMLTKSPVFPMWSQSKWVFEYKVCPSSSCDQAVTSLETACRIFLFCQYISLFFLMYLNWSIIASQCCAIFCCTTKWISHMHTYIPICPPSWASPHPPYPTPLGVVKHQADLPVLCCCFPLAIYFTFGSVYMLLLLSLCPIFPLPSPLCPQVHSLCLRIHSFPATRFISTICFRFHIYALAYGICFSLSVAVCFSQGFPESQKQ